MLRAEGLRHAFGRIRALDDITFALAAGETLTILGPNGAGKTTLLRVLAGLIHPQGGRVALDGGRRAVGWIGHAAHLYGHLTVRENILFWAALYDVPRGTRPARTDAVLARVGLADRAGQEVRTLSRGLLQRTAIARALVHDPRVLLLDEPFTGLDLAAAAEFRRLLHELAAGGRAMVLATHNVEEGAELATHIAFQRAGRFVAFTPRGGRGAAEIADAYRRAMADA
jgi:heme ABC exporter ATP-binding subunit CcmA